MASTSLGSSVRSSGSLLLFVMLGAGAVLLVSRFIPVRLTKPVSFSLHPAKQSLEQVLAIQGEILNFDTSFQNASPDTIELQMGIPCSCLEIRSVGTGVPISFPLRVEAGGSADFEIKLNTAGRMGRVEFKIPLSVSSLDKVPLWEEKFEIAANVDTDLVALPSALHLTSATNTGVISLCDSLVAPRYQIAEVTCNSPFLKTDISKMAGDVMYGGKPYHCRGAIHVSLESHPISDKPLDPIVLELTAELLANRKETRVFRIPIMVEPTIVRVVPERINLQCGDSKMATSKLLVFRSSGSSSIESLPNFCEVVSVSRSTTLDTYNFRASEGIGEFIVRIGEHRIVVPIQINPEEKRES